MSRWSSTHTSLLIFLAVGLGPALMAGAQDTAILREGPDPVRGIPYLATNALAAFQGAYVIRSRDSQGGLRTQPVAEEPPAGLPVAKVIYTRVPLVLPREWAPARCGSLRLLRVSSQEHYALCYQDEQGYTLFFEFPWPEPSQQGELSPQACAFAESFVRRFQILLGFLDASREPPFPAILQLPR